MITDLWPLSLFAAQLLGPSLKLSGFCSTTSVVTDPVDLVQRVPEFAEKKAQECAKGVVTAGAFAAILLVFSVASYFARAATVLGNLMMNKPRMPPPSPGG